MPDKVKGLLKGFRYISHIFENEKEKEMQIGLPTDVKHVAHIGWDGPSVNSPSWMNEFKQASKSAPQPLAADRDFNTHADVSQDSNKRASRFKNAHEAEDSPDLPKSSRRQSTGSIADSPKRDKSDKPKSSTRKTSKLKDSTDGTARPTRLPADLLEGGDSPASLPDIPKKPHRKKPKEASNGTSRSKVKAQTTHTNSDDELPVASTTKSRNKKKSLEDDGGAEKGSGAIS